MTKLATVHRIHAKRLTGLESREASQRAITACVQCGKPIEARTEQEWTTMLGVQVHEGDCWRALKRGE